MSSAFFDVVYQYLFRAGKVPGQVIAGLLLGGLIWMGFLPLAIAHYNREKFLLHLVCTHALASKHVPLRVVIKGRIDGSGDTLILLRTLQGQSQGHGSHV